MNELVSRAQSVLLGGGYSTRLVSVDDVPVVLFEDEVVSGFVFALQSPQALLQRWRDLETSLLTRFARNLRVAGDKAWNVYSVFLCEGPCDAALSRQVAWIEEDLQRTRKVAACGVDTRERVLGALLPLLPLQHQPELGPEDLTARLRARIRQVAPEATEAYLDESVSAAEVARLLRGAP